MEQELEIVRQARESLTDRDRRLYEITEENGTIWVRHIDVGNTLFQKG